MEWEINTSLPVSYRNKISWGVLSPGNSDMATWSATGDGKSNRRLVVVDKKVNEIYGERILAYFAHHSLVVRIVVIDGIEAHKSTDSLFMLLNEMEQFGINRRNECLISIGGGVIQDIVGFAASMYRRGVPYMRVPTTLLGIVDVSIAAKVGINWEERRNRLGAYYPPVCSLLDQTFIKTQEPIEISSGMGEILKMAVIKDARLFSLIETKGKALMESRFDHPISGEVISRSIQGMKEELENNLWERDLKRCVDFGHSFSPIIEMRSLETDNPLTHGQAVTIDVLFSCRISEIRGLLHSEDVGRAMACAHNMGLLTSHPMFEDVSLLLEALNDTTKHRGGNQNLPIPTEIGEYTFINDLTFEEICEAAKRL